MRARTVSLLIVAAVAVAGLLTVIIPRVQGSSDPTTAYCKTIAADQAQIGDVINSSDSQTALIDSLDLFQGMAANAPADIAGSWTALTTAIGGLRSAIQASGHQPTEFAAGKFPKGLTAAQKQAVVAAADTLNSTTTLAAAGAIQQEVRDVCQIDLDM